MNRAFDSLAASADFLARPVAVTGATGMVGSHLVAELLRAGYSDITLPVRNPSRILSVETLLGRFGIVPPAGVLKIVETELADPPILEKKLPGIDTVFNCAARIMSGDMTAGELIENNVSIARSVVGWCMASGVKKLIHVSSISALGEPAGKEEPVREDCEPAHVESYAAYGRSKYYSEKEVWRAAKEGLAVVVVSPGVILGEGDPHANGSAALIPAISCGQPFYTNGLMSYVDVRDVARALVMLDAAPDAAGGRFILSAGNMTYKELITLAARAAGRPVPFIPIGQGAVDFAYCAMQTGIKLRLIKDKGVTRENLGSVLRTTRYDGSKISRLYGFDYTPLPETIERVVKSCRPGRANGQHTLGGYANKRYE